MQSTDGYQHYYEPTASHYANNNDCPACSMQHQQEQLLAPNAYPNTSAWLTSGSYPYIESTTGNLSYPTVSMMDPTPVADSNNGNHPRCPCCGYCRHYHVCCIRSCTPASQRSDNEEFKPSFYNPFEVKHRKRTSRAQYKVLEREFHENPKPNAQKRRALAEQLSMTPRGVQVWFQNRRAKAKAQQRKLLEEQQRQREQQEQQQSQQQLMHQCPVLGTWPSSPASPSTQGWMLCPNAVPLQRLPSVSSYTTDGLSSGDSSPTAACGEDNSLMTPLTPPYVSLDGQQHRPVISGYMTPSLEDTYDRDTFAQPQPCLSTEIPFSFGPDTPLLGYQQQQSNCATQPASDLVTTISALETLVQPFEPQFANQWLEPTVENMKKLSEPIFNTEIVDTSNYTETTFFPSSYTANVQ